jgi:hypothetical protein
VQAVSSFWLKNSLRRVGSLISFAGRLLMAVRMVGSTHRKIIEAARSAPRKKSWAMAEVSEVGGVSL